MQEALKRSQNKDDLYLLVLDVDRFKNINDQYGHIEGDKALVRLADAMRETGKLLTPSWPATAEMSLSCCTKPPNRPTLN